MIFAEVVTVSFDINTKIEAVVFIVLMFFIFLELVEIKNNLKRL
jgi:hypothetical protein